MYYHFPKVVRKEIFDLKGSRGVVCSVSQDVKSLQSLVVALAVSSSGFLYRRG